MEVLLKIKNATPGNIKSKLNKALKRLGTDFHIEKCTKIRKSEKGRKLQGRINFQGLNISIENRKGSIRYGIDSDGHSWKTKMNYPYGRIIGVQRLGHDGDHIDCYVGDNRQSDKVYIIHIKDCVTGKYDEDKIMLGFNNQKEVIAAFKTQYDNFSKIFDGIEKMSIYEFKECLKKKTKSIIVKLKDFTRENADYKITKALAGVSKALNCDFICKSIYNKSDRPRAENGRFIEKTDISTPNNEAICQTLKNNIAPMPIEIPFTRENYDNLFKNGIETPIGHVKLGENQYDKLKDKDLGSRQRILAPMYETLKNPALIIETKDNAKLFCKEFCRPDGSDKLMVSVVIDRNNLLISISTHIERLSQVQKKCRTILYKKNPNGNVGYAHHDDVPRTSSISKPINKSINHAEKPSYQALQDIIDNSNAEVEKIKRQAYNFICKYLGLPKINKINKSITDELTVNGKVIFDPLYGKPLKQKDFVQMINKLENFLSRRLAESERQMLLQSTALGHLIALSKSGQTQLLLETTKLKNIRLNGKSFDSLCTDYNALKNNFEKVTETEIKKLQFIEDKIGVYVTSAKDATIKIIKDIYYDAVINHKNKQQISQEMYDQLGFLNRSWDTIARTESNNLKNHAFIVGSLNDEGKTYFRRRVGSYNTCKICASHRDKIALWSEKPLTDDTINDELADIAIWSGKSNIGRNQKDWWIPEGSTHPNCFCEWEKLLDSEVKYFKKSFNESDHPRGNGGRFTKKFSPDKDGDFGGSSEAKKESKLTSLLEEYSELKEKQIKNAIIPTQKDFERIIDNFFVKNYKNIPAIIKLPALDEYFVKELDISGDFYLSQQRLKHINPTKKTSHNNQDFRIEEYKDILNMIKRAKNVYIDTNKNNFFIAEKDSQNEEYVNTIIFNKDKLGSYLVTIRKVCANDLKRKEIKSVKTGVAPAITDS